MYSNFCTLAVGWLIFHWTKLLPLWTTLLHLLWEKLRKKEWLLCQPVLMAKPMILVYRALKQFCYFFSFMSVAQTSVLCKSTNKLSNLLVTTTVAWKKPQAWMIIFYNNNDDFSINTADMLTTDDAYLSTSYSKDITSGDGLNWDQ